jgi:hypothetical protein
MNNVAYWLSLIFIFIIPWETAIAFGDMGTLARFIGGATAVAWLMSKIIRDGKIRKPHLFHFTVIAYITWNLSSAYWSFNVDMTLQHIKTYMQLMIMSYIFWDLYRLPKALIAVMVAYILGAYVTIGSTIANYIAGHEYALHAFGRYVGARLNAGEQALILSLGLPFAWHIATSTIHKIKNKLLKVICYCYIPLSLFAELLTASRTALLLVMPVMFYMCVTARRIKPLLRYIIFVFLLTSTLALLSYLPIPTVNRLSTIYDSIADADLGGRVILWRNSLVVFTKHPILGVGSGSLRATKEVDSTAHNTFFSVMAELGLIGFILFLGILIVIIIQAFKQPKNLSALWFTILATWFIGVFTLTWEHTKTTWLLFTLIIISANLSSD